MPAQEDGPGGPHQPKHVRERGALAAPRPSGLRSMPASSVVTLSSGHRLKLARWLRVNLQIAQGGTWYAGRLR